MTNEQAIHLLHRLQDEQFDGIHGDERREALEMAVRALEGDGDTIYRQQAIDAVSEGCQELRGVFWECKEKLLALPPAQPEVLACGSGELVQEPDGLVKDLVKDSISRQQAIDYCYQLINVEHQQGSDEMNYGQERVNQTETILHHLELMPSAQPERKTGKWIDGQCSICGCDVPAYIIDWKWQKDMDANFCPNCGARMEGESDGNN